MGRRVNGALLDDGAIVPLPPLEAARFASLLTPGQTISVEGDVNASVRGRVVDAAALGPAGSSMNQIDAPPRPGGPDARWGTPRGVQPIGKGEEKEWRKTLKRRRLIAIAALSIG
jgi:hypothetical protein